VSERRAAYLVERALAARCRLCTRPAVGERVLAVRIGGQTETCSVAVCALHRRARRAVWRRLLGRRA
jgi:hypothetical protein